MRFLYFLPAVLLFGLTRPVFALSRYNYNLPCSQQPNFPQWACFTNKIIDLIINPVIWFLIAVASLIFFFGAVRFIIANRAGDEEGILAGKKHIVWGIVGLFIMLSVLGIIDIIIDFFQ